jgi:hypothetical protein
MLWKDKGGESRVVTYSGWRGADPPRLGRQGWWCRDRDGGGFGCGFRNLARSAETTRGPSPDDFGVYMKTYKDKLRPQFVNDLSTVHHRICIILSDV